MSVCYEVSGAKMAAPASQTSQDKKDLDYLEKLIKFFALKSAQIIVQARLGRKVRTECNPDSTQTDWIEEEFALSPKGLSVPCKDSGRVKTKYMEEEYGREWYIDQVEIRSQVYC